jgi:hypothetical protein
MQELKEHVSFRPRKLSHDMLYISPSFQSLRAVVEEPQSLGIFEVEGHGYRFDAVEVKILDWAVLNDATSYADYRQLECCLVVTLCLLQLLSSATASESTLMSGYITP